MSNAASDTWRQSIQLHDELLAKLESRRRELEKTQRAAQIAFDVAKEDLDAVTGQMNDITTQCKMLLQKNRALRQRLSSRMLRRLPPELLRMIFVEVLLCFDRDDGWPDIVHTAQAKLVRAPFALAAVCSQWRKVALLTPQIWAFISIPLNNGTIPLHALSRVQLLLERSKAVSLDVLLPWKGNVELAWAAGEGTLESEILLHLGEHCARWRRFELHLPAGALSRDSMSVIRGATPQLEELCIIGGDIEDLVWEPTLPNFLPFCPKMRHFRSDFCNIVMSPTNPSLHMLSELELFVDMPFAVIWGILRLAAPCLSTLDLRFDREPPEPHEMLSSRINFPRLSFLTITHQASIMFATNAALVSFPALTKLAALGESLPALLSLWEHTPNKIRHLEIIDDSVLDSDDVQFLHPYTNVDILTIGADCSVDDTFLLGLAEKGADARWIMPALQSLVIISDTIYGESLMVLLRARQEAHAQGGAGTPCRIRHVDFQNPNVPDWLISQVRFLLDSGSS